MLSLQAQVFKQNGNDEFKKGNYQRAIDLFTQAIGKCFNYHFILIN